MNILKPSTLSQYFAWLVKQYQTAYQATNKPDAYRIVDMDNQATKPTVTIQVVGKSTTFKCYPAEVLADDNLLDKFSRQDIRTLTYLACNKPKKSKLRILSQEFSDKLNRMVFAIRKPHSDEVIKTTADKISTNADILSQLNQTDAHMVGYTAATEQMLQEKEQLKQLQSQEA